MPTAQLQKMREKLRENDIALLVSKRRVMKIALEKAKTEKKGVEEIEKYLLGMPALIFSKKDSFKLYKLLKTSKTEASAKPGQIAPRDIEIKAGPTNFMPGPIISELAAVGLKAGVEAGKVAIKENKIICREGEKISQKISDMLTKLNIKPMEIGLNLVASFENGTIFKKDVLDIDEKKFMENLIKSASESFNLSVEIGYLTKENIELVVRNVFYSCKGLAEESKFLADVVVEDMLSNAERSAKSIVKSAGLEISKTEQKLIKEEDAILKEEKKLERTGKDEVSKAVKEIEEKALEKERIDDERKITTEEKIAKMVNAQKKHATGEDKKESAEYLVNEAKD